MKHLLFVRIVQFMYIFLEVFDDKSCEIVSKRMGLPYDDILYAPLGKVFIMHSGMKPIHIPRYDTFNSAEYKEYLRANKLAENLRGRMMDDYT